MHLWKLGTLLHFYLQFTQTLYKTQTLGLNCLWFIPDCAIHSFADGANEQNSLGLNK